MTFTFKCASQKHVDDLLRCFDTKRLSAQTNDIAIVVLATHGDTEVIVANSCPDAVELVGSDARRYTRTIQENTAVDDGPIRHPAANAATNIRVIDSIFVEGTTIF